jgi:uncharacterized protein YlxW (UPF0749 family)
MDFWSHPLVVGAVLTLLSACSAAVLATIRSVLTEVRATRSDLRVHMAAEEALREAEQRDRVARQAEIDTRMGRLEKAIDETRRELKADVAEMHDRLDATLTQLIAGHPEIRRS